MFQSILGNPDNFEMGERKDDINPEDWPKLYFKRVVEDAIKNEPMKRRLNELLNDALERKLF